MKILSRPAVEQPCREIVEKALDVLFNVGSLNTPVGTMQAEALIPVSVTQYDTMVRLIFETLTIAGVLKRFEVGTAAELASSEYKHEKWRQNVRFSGDGTNFYTAQLTFEYRR